MAVTCSYPVLQVHLTVHPPPTSMYTGQQWWLTIEGKPGVGQEGWLGTGSRAKPAEGSMDSGKTQMP